LGQANIIIVEATYPTSRCGTLLKLTTGQADKKTKGGPYINTMRISANQVSAVIRTYLKNAMDRLDNDSSSGDLEEQRDEVTVSEDARRILYERIGKRLVQKLRDQMAADSLTAPQESVPRIPTP